MNTFIKELTSLKWKYSYGTYFESMQSLCNHLYICDYNWLKRYSALREFKYIQMPVFKVDAPFGRAVFNSIDEYIPLRNELDTTILAFAKELREEDMDKDLTYTDSKGPVYTRNFGELVLHLFNHQTHHRGMISIFLEKAGIDNDFTNIYDLPGDKD